MALLPSISALRHRSHPRKSGGSVSARLWRRRMHSLRLSVSKVKAKFTILHIESIGRCSSPSSRPWARRWRTTNVCDAWPVQRQTYGYLPSRKASPPTGWYEIILLGDRGTCMLITCPGLHSTAERLGFEPATCWLQVQRPNHSATEPHKCKWRRKIKEATS